MCESHFWFGRFGYSESIDLCLYCIFLKFICIYFRFYSYSRLRTWSIVCSMEQFNLHLRLGFSDVFSSSRHWVALRCMLLCVIVDSKEGAVWSEQPPYLYFRQLKEKINQISRTDRGCWWNIRVFKMSFKLFKKMGRRLKSQNFLKSFCFLKIFPKFPFKYTLQDVSIYLHLRLNHICFEIEKNSIWIHFLWKMTIPKQGVSLRAFCIKHKRKAFIKPPCFSGKLRKNWK